MIWWRMGVMWWIKYWTKQDRKVRVVGRYKKRPNKVLRHRSLRPHWMDGTYPHARKNVSWHPLADLQAALYCAKVASYAQGMGIIEAASTKHGWNADLSLCALMWRGGCIIRAQLLTKIKNAYTINPTLPNLMIDPTFASELNERQMAWRRVVSVGVATGITTPALSSALAYYDQYRRDRLPANLVQAQRDFFGGHTYQRTDRDGTFHCLWDETHKDIGDLAGRTAGEV
jgi:6-phosphogluconate dehydrogenase